eukprot:GAFH01000816.1.p2 GENE.GAFH01000816.1~~GAFH01000816.1.p2  ORF type:complete len:908 (-),score=304.98 GAFH01000816.1:71-2548(-)
MQPGRDYGSVFLVEGNENLALSCVAEGWCDVKEIKDAARRPSYYEDLVRARNAAKERKIGKWQENHAAGIHDIAELRDEEAREMMEKGREYPAIIESIPSAHSFRVLLKGQWKMLNIMLNGVQCPPSREAVGAEARYFVEVRLLNREVTVRMDDVTPQGVLGAILVPQGDMTLELIRQGFGRFTPASIRTLPKAYSDSLRAAERDAQQRKARVWANWVPPVVASTTARREYHGICVEVISGDTVSVMPAPTATNPHPREERLSLSSIRAPRLAPRTDEMQRNEPWAWEARDALRRLLVGQQVRVRVEYTRPLSGVTPDGATEREFASIYVGSVNVAERLVSDGLATVQRHKQGEERALDYEMLQVSEEAARKANLRVHNRSQEAPVHRFQTLVGNPRLAKEYRPKFQRVQRAHAIVEAIVTASRFRVFVPQYDCVISFVLGALRAPNVDRIQAGRVIIPGEPYGPEALSEARLHLLNREVEITVDTVDQRGNFIGTLFFQGKNIASRLLADGLARIGGGPAARTVGDELRAIEEAARTAKKGLWAFPLPDEQADQEDEEERAPAPESRPVYRNASVTDVIDGATVCIQIATPPDQAITAHIDRLLAAPESAPTVAVYGVRGGRMPEPNAMVAVRSEGVWRRAKVLDVDAPHALVNYIDYDTESDVDLSPSTPVMVALPEEFVKQDPCAMCCFLAFLAPPPQEEFQGRATEHLKQLTNDRVYDARLEYLDHRKRRYVSLLPAADERPGQPQASLQESLNAIMVRAGLAMAGSEEEVPRAFHTELAAIRQEEAVANKAHANLWSYGDVRPDEEEQRGPRRGGRGGRR